MKKEQKRILIICVICLVTGFIVWLWISHFGSRLFKFPGLDSIDFITPALYFFSTIAQTMGALLAISFAILSLSKKPSDFSKPYQYEPYKRIIFNDPHLKTFIQFSAISTVASIISLIVLYLAGPWNLLSFIWIPVGVFVVTISTIAICNIYHFIRYKYQIMSGTAMILRQFRNELENKKTHKDTIIDYFEIAILDANNTKLIFNKTNIIELVEKHLIKEIELETLFDRLYEDISLYNLHEKTHENLFIEMINDKKVLYENSEQIYEVSNFDKLLIEFLNKSSENIAMESVTATLHNKFSAWFTKENMKSNHFLSALFDLMSIEIPNLQKTIEKYRKRKKILVHHLKDRSEKRPWG